MSSDPPRRLHVVTFGCQMSAADGDELARPLVERGLRVVGDADDADAIIVNTCTVRQHAEDRAVSLLGRLRPWKEARPERFLIVAGCAAERLGGWIQKRFPYVDLVVGAKSIEEYPSLLEEALDKRFEWTKDDWDRDERRRPETTGPAAFVTIMRGCNYSCTYCIVPAVRGRELYRPFDVILNEARARVAAGASELMLLGQTVNSYRAPDGRDFADLLRAVGALPGVARLRFMSPHPHYVGPRMIAAMAETPAVCPHLHLPLQSGSDAVLRRMRRNYAGAEYLDKVERLRRSIPGLAISTDVIAGFPGETESDLEDTLAALRRLDPTFTYCFKFSPREGTEAAELAQPVAEPVKEARLRRLLDLTEGLQRDHLERKVGTTVRILLEDERRGRTEDYFHAKLEAPSTPGTIVEAEVTGSVPQGLRTRLIGKNVLDMLASQP
ncbi:MAG: tRNA (N6-isopentenyl adenosine(37)-C2)-methylthiotransferase MiaB [Elusimicrobia bacterium]|nr:tRNA (N6-isopentenyl adenosine(37)-C2)-methylthiotransferase MiaB [Elusimicrobiota bacterium]